MTAQKVDWHPPVVLEPRSVDVPTAAAALGLGEDVVWAEVHAGNLRHIRHGRRVLIPVPALDEWVAEKERAS